ncbi:MAG: zincin-like metallopeptidase domain-containing protein [Aestuariivita sp.]|nr:zincin-like metallopeptidase domain-containing protein [Aestuariivita sp.]
MRSEIYQNITNQIIADLEEGELTWLKPWGSEDNSAQMMRPLRHDGQFYNGINILILWSVISEHKFTSPYWMTFRQAIAYGAHVKKGERGTSVVYANSFTNIETNVDGEEEEYVVPFLKHYTVFNVDQITDLPDRFYVHQQPVISENMRIQNAEDFFSLLNVEIQHSGDNAYYSPKKDFIKMPDFTFFHSPEAYYATLAHELIHWTAHENRLNRGTSVKSPSKEEYAKEELIAELGSAFICADLNLKPLPGKDHAAYIQSWLTILKEDKKMIFKASAAAQRAVDYIKKLTARNNDDQKLYASAA